MTNNAVKRLAKLRERKRICRGAIEDEIGVALRLEEIAHRLAKTTRPFVVTIRFGRAAISLFERGHRFGTNTDRIVTREFVVRGRFLHRVLANRHRAAQQTGIPI
jgi:hypothetical protein